MKQKFCFDTSVFINGWRKHYGINAFPSFWKKIEELMADGVVVSCNEVYEELKRQNDDLFKWAKQRKLVFENPSEDITFQLQELMNEYPNFAATGGTLNAADPWVISHARIGRAHVVTYEIRAKKRKPTVAPKIPDVCDDLSMQSFTVVEFLEALGIKF